MPEQAARHFFHQLVHAVAHCHARGVAHRDIKLENVLIDLEGHIKLTDFGLAGVFRIQEGGAERLLSDRCGSKAYVAPELIADRSSPYVGPPVDVWACGVCLFAMLANFFPFDVACARRDWRVPHVQLAQAAGGSTVRTLYELASRPCDFSAEVTALLDSMLALDPARRATLADVLASPWLAASPAGTPYATPQPSDGAAPADGAAADASVLSVLSVDQIPAQGENVETAADEPNAPLVDEHDPAEVYRDVSAMVNSGSHSLLAPTAEASLEVGEEGVYRSALPQPTPGVPAAAHVPALRRERAFERWSNFEQAYDADMVVAPRELLDIDLV